MRERFQLSNSESIRVGRKQKHIGLLIPLADLGSWHSSNHFDIRNRRRIRTQFRLRVSHQHELYGQSQAFSRSIENLHSYDVARFIHAFTTQPRTGEVYNIGGGRQNSVSILEAFEHAASLSGRKMAFEYLDQPRAGDHICYISDLSKMRLHYPGWDITKSIEQVFTEIYASYTAT